MRTYGEIKHLAEAVLAEKQQQEEKKFEIKDEIDWFRLDEEQLDFYLDEKECHRVNVKARAGSLVLWDSRTVHCGMKPLKTRKEPNFRLVTYVCMTPREWCSDEAINVRRDAFTNLYMTTHCPHRPKLFPKVPKRYFKEAPIVPDFEHPKLSELGLSLSGF